MHLNRLSKKSSLNKLSTIFRKADALVISKSSAAGVFYSWFIKRSLIVGDFHMGKTIIVSKE